MKQLLYGSILPIVGECLKKKLILADFGNMYPKTLMCCMWTGSLVSSEEVQKLVVSKGFFNSLFDSLIITMDHSRKAIPQKKWCFA